MAMMKNRIPLILLLNIAGVALFCSWYLPANHGAWLPVDSAIFHFFNHGVSVSHAYAWLLAIINNRAFDACSLLAMGCLMLSYWLKAPTAGRRQIAIMGLVMLLAAVIIAPYGKGNVAWFVLAALLAGCGSTATGASSADSTPAATEAAGSEATAPTAEPQTVARDETRAHARRIRALRQTMEYHTTLPGGIAHLGGSLQ